MKDNIFYIILFLIGTTLFYGCGKGQTETTTTIENKTYATTSTKGDYSEWSLNTDRTLHAVWQVINSMGTTDYTHTFDAECTAPTATGLQECEFRRASCRAGVLACPSLLSGTFSMLNIPDVAIFIETNDGRTRQLHIGFLKDDNACSEDVSGDYLSMHIGLGKRDIFGVYRSDENFTNITHADFGFETGDANVHQILSYNTSSTSNSLVDKGCLNGVREWEISGGLIRSMMTKSGLFVLDLPAGQGGMLSFKVENSATLEDMANKTFGGYSFPDNADAKAISLTSSAVVDHRITLNTIVGAEREVLRIMPLAVPDNMTTPTYPSFTSAPLGYESNPLSSVYTAPSNLVGLYKLDGLHDEGRVILSALKHNGKVVLLGTVYNYRTTTNINPSTGLSFSENGLYNTGSLIAFER